MLKLLESKITNQENKKNLIKDLPKHRLAKFHLKEHH